MKSLTRDDGFTLSELLVVLALLGVILGIAWTAFNFVRVASEESERQAQISRDIGAPMNYIDSLLSQAFDFDTTYPGVTPYRCAFYNDQDADGNRERYLFEVVGSQLRTTSMEETERPSRQTVWSEANTNISSGTPLFRYYDANGTEITNMSDVPQDVKRIVVTITSTRGDVALSDTRNVFLRNR